MAAVLCHGILELKAFRVAALQPLRRLLPKQDSYRLTGVEAPLALAAADGAISFTAVDE
jgi:hypothetical protein